MRTGPCLWRVHGPVLLRSSQCGRGDQDKDTCGTSVTTHMRSNQNVRWMRFCPWPFSLYIIFLGDSSLLSWLWLPLMTLKSIISNPCFSTEFQTYVFNCQQGISTLVSHRPPILHMSATKLVLLTLQPASQPASSIWVDKTVGYPVGQKQWGPFDSSLSLSCF